MIYAIKRYIKYMGKNRNAYFLVMSIAVLLQVVGAISYSYMYKMAFNSIETQDYILFKQSIIFATISFLSYLIAPLFNFLTLQQVREIMFNNKVLIFDKFLKRDISYFEKNHSGDFLKKLGNDTSYLKEPYFNAKFYLSTILVGLSSIILILIFDYRLGLISFFFSFISVITTKKINEGIADKSNNVYKSLGKLSEFLVDILSGFLVLKMFRGRDLIEEKYLSENSNVKENMVNLTKSQSKSEVVSFLIGMIGKFGTIIIGVIFAKNNQIDYGTIMAIVSLQSAVTSSFLDINRIYSDFTYGLTISSRVFDFIEEDGVTENFESTNICPLEIEKGITFENLSFSYDGEHKILKDLNLQIKENEKIILRGESGCGKSTILKLLLKFYDSYDGKIEIFGNDLKDYSLDQLRGLITYIPQDSFLFDTTVKENVLFAKKEKGDFDITEALEKAYAYEFVSNFENGFDENIKLGGTNISGGERQRLSIARAFLKNSPIIIMDEPTSALDSESEKKIDLAIEELSKNKIVIMVTHKMKEYKYFDTTVILK